MRPDNLQAECAETVFPALLPDQDLSPAVDVLQHAVELDDRVQLRKPEIGPPDHPCVVHEHRLENWRRKPFVAHQHPEPGLTHRLGKRIGEVQGRSDRRTAWPELDHLPKALEVLDADVRTAQRRIRTHDGGLERGPAGGLDQCTSDRRHRHAGGLGQIQVIEHPAMVPYSGRETVATAGPRQLNLGEIGVPDGYAVHDQGGVMTDDRRSRLHRVHCGVHELPVAEHLPIPGLHRTEVCALGVLPVPDSHPPAVRQTFTNLLAGVSGIDRLTRADNAALAGRNPLQLWIHPASIQQLQPRAHPTFHPCGQLTPQRTDPPLMG